MVIKVAQGTFSKSTSTSTPVSQSVTHTGDFTGNALILYGVAHSSATATHSQHSSVSYGFSDGTNHRSVCANAKSEGVWQFEASDAFRRSASTVYTSLGDGTNATKAECTVTSFANNQFTVSWTTNNAVADVVHYVVMQVDNVKVGEFTAKTGSTGTVDTTGLGFTPVDGDLILFLSASGTAALPSTVNHGLLTVGAMSKSTARATNTVSWENAVTTTDTHTLLKTDKALSLCTDSTGAIDSEADFSAWITDGFRLNWTDFAASAWKIFYLAIHGGNWDVGNDTQPTSNQVKTTTVAATVETVKGLMLFSAGLAAASTVQEGGRMSIGSADSATSESGMWTQMQDAHSNNVNTLGGAVREYYTNKILSCQTTTAGGSDVAPVINSQCDVDSFGTDQFGLNWTTTDATARQFLYIVVGAASGQVFTRSPTAEDVTVTDSSLTRIVSALRLPSTDSTTVTDSSLTRILSAARVPSSDSVTVAESSLTRSKTMPGVPTADTTVVTDVSTTQMITRSRLPSTETVTPSEASLTRMLSASRAPSLDSVTAVDSSTTGIKALTRLPSTDSTTVSDASLTRLLQLFRAPTTENPAISEDLSRSATRIRTVSTDSVTAEDSSTTQIITRVRVPSADSITAEDSSVNRLLSALRLPSTEVTSVSDASLTRMLQAFRVPTGETVTVNENVTGGKVYGRAPIAEDITVSDVSVIRVYSALRIPSTETVTVAENSLNRMLSAIRVPSTESVTTAEDIDIVHTTAGQFNRAPATENITVSDASLTRLLSAIRAPNAETVNLNEQLSRLLSLSRSPTADSTSVSENAPIRMLTSIRSLSETPSVVEASLTRILSAIRNPIQETVTVNELASLISHSRRLEEIIAVTEPLIQRIVTAIRAVTPADTIVVNEQVFYQALHKFVFDSVTVAEQLFIVRQGLSGSVTYATPAEVRPLLGNLGAQRTDAQIQLAVDSAYDEINRKTNRIPPNDWKDTEADFSIIKKIARYKAALEMSIGIKDFEDREAMQKEVDEMFMIIEQNDPGGTLSNDMVISSDDETYALNPSGIIWSTRYKNLRKGASGLEGSTTINTDT